MLEDEIATGTHIPGHTEPYLFQVNDVVDGRYSVRSQLGQGGMGAVLRVENISTHETLALKYCRPGQDRQRFAREVRIMQGIQSPHVIPIVASNVVHDPPYFVMPLADRSLELELSDMAGNEDTALTVFRQLCLGVQDLHDRGVYHRDLKPANVLRLSDGRIVICDLGLARLETRDTTILTRTIGWLGTEGYLAPEQQMPEGSRNADVRTDVYQLGKVLYQILTGRHPRLVDFKTLPPGLDSVVRRATVEDPSDRYPNVEKLVAALDRYQSSKDPRQSPREVLEHLVTRLKAEYPEAAPPEADLGQVLEVLSHGAGLEPRLVIESFHRIPEHWMANLARDHEPSLYPVLCTYTSAIDERVAGYQWQFADDVSILMMTIYEYSGSVRTKVSALRNLMTAAEQLRRFDAQRTFCNCLESIKTIDLALPVAEMIAECARPYLDVFRGYNVDLYHPAIRAALIALHEKAEGAGGPS